MNQFFIKDLPVLSNPELVLFDKDGTLIDIHHYWTTMIKIRSLEIIQKWFSFHRNRAKIQYDLCSAMGVDMITGQIKKEGPVGIKPRNYIVNVAATIVRVNKIKILNTEMESLFADVDMKTSVDMLPLLRVLPGAIELLEILKSCGISSVIVSNDLSTRARLAFETLEMGHLFVDILGGDSVENAKPAPDIGLLALENQCCDANKTIVIGDHPVDIQMGELIKTGLNIGVLTGMSEKKDFEGMNCIVVNDLSELTVRC